jgi:cell division protein FtsN
LAIWAVNYGLGSLLGLAIYLVLLFTVELTTPQILTAVLGPVLIFNLAFARHAKAIFLAFDHFCDPHRPPGDDGDGNRPKEKPPTNQSPSGGLPWPTEPPRVKTPDRLKPERV